MKNNNSNTSLKRGRPPKKDYDPEALMQELIDTAAEIYQEKREIKATALELNLPPGKVKKLLITGNVLPYPETKQIQGLMQQGKNMAEIQHIMGLSYSALHTLMAAPTEGHLWDCIIAFQNYPFHTVSSLPFSYTLKKGRNGDYTKELFIDRRENSKSLAWSSVRMAFERALEQQGAVFTRPKELADVRGVSYTFSLLWRFGMISAPADVERKLKGNRK